MKSNIDAPQGPRVDLPQPSSNASLNANLHVEDHAWNNDGSSDSEQDSCADEEVETDDLEILANQDGRALSRKLASEVCRNI
jgi:hypothetical protein